MISDCPAGKNLGRVRTLKDCKLKLGGGSSRKTEDDQSGQWRRTSMGTVLVALIQVSVMARRE